MGVPDDDSPPVALVVEDDRVVQAGLARFLGSHGFRAVVSDSVAEAIAIGRRERVAGVTLDLSLSGSNGGLDFLLWLRHTPAYVNTPVVVLTGATTVRSDQASVIRSMGATLLFKPAPYDSVLESLRHRRRASAMEQPYEGATCNTLGQ